MTKAIDFDQYGNVEIGTYHAGVQLSYRRLVATPASTARLLRLWRAYADRVRDGLPGVRAVRCGGYVLERELP